MEAKTENYTGELHRNYTRTTPELHQNYTRKLQYEAGTNSETYSMSQNSEAKKSAAKIQSDLIQQESKSQGISFNAIQAGDFSPPEMTGYKVKKKIPAAWIAVIVLVVVGLTLMLYLRMSTAVLVMSNPTDATVDIEGFAPVIANSYLLLPGEYQITANAPGYFEKNETLVVKQADSQVFDLNLKPLPGHINVDSNVSELQVMVNGQDNKTTLPGLLTDIPLGEYQFTFSSYRYFSKVVDFSVDGFDKTQELFVELEPAWGQLEISSQPEGAEVQLDGVVIGQTPLIAEVLETGSEVSLTKSGFNSWSETLTVKAGGVEKYERINLQPADGIVFVTSKPSGANVTIDDQFVGRTPYNSKLSSGALHKIKLFIEGYKVLNRELLLQAEESQSHHWTLKPELGQVQLRVRPAQAKITINGQDYGSGNKTLNLVANEQLIEVKLEGYVSQKRRIVPKIGLTQSLSFNLLTEKQHYWAQFPDRVTVAGIGLKLMRPDAAFTMGTSRRESGRRSNEAQRSVLINKPFYIASYETTNGQFQLFDREHNSLQLAAISLNGSSQPVVNIDWFTAAKFCNWLSEQEQLKPVYVIAGDKFTQADLSANGYRLPTEAEWAWLARVEDNGDLRRYIWGENYPPTVAVANYADGNSKTLLGRSVPGYDDGHTVSAPVGSYPADAKGVYDMAGNVSEWIHDFYSITPNKGEPELNPSGPPSGRDHVIRGASWRHGSRTEIRLSYREFGNEAKLDIGFRVARNIE